MKFKFWVALSWTLFNVMLAAWWLVYGLQHTSGDALRWMLISEGCILILSLLLGGGALLYYMRKEERRSLEVRAFFATFSHELKTSIGSLRIQVESLVEDFKGVSSPLLDRLVQDSIRLEIQLENSLSLSQIQSSDLYVEEVSLKNILSLVEHQWPGVQISLEGDFRLSADRRALETILRNLIQNSTVHGEATRILISVKQAEGRVHISVIDNGRGFQGNRNRLGELFFRHNSHSGSGVGLNLIASLLKKMGGSISFPNRPQGFEADIQLPVRSQSMPKILFVEDNASLGATLYERLKKEGYDSIWVQTLLDARKNFNSQLSLVILDVGLPDGSGFDFAREVRSKSGVPFLFVTAQGSPEDRLMGYELGAEEYILKPFHLKEFLIRVKRVLEKTQPQVSASLPYRSICFEKKIDWVSRSVTLADGKIVYLPLRDFLLLRLLAEKAPQVVSREEIMKTLWNEDENHHARTIDNAIVRLRQLLADRDAEVIRSVRGVGYQWVGPLDKST